MHMQSILAAAVAAVAVLVVLCCTSQSMSLILISRTPYISTDMCPEPPLCESPRLTLFGVALCLLKKAPLPFNSADYAAYVKQRLEKLGEHHIKGQYAVQPVAALVAHKLRNMRDPLVFHFAGDNGVGKTRLAEVVSLAVAQRCHPHAGCRIGDSTLELSGTSYAGMSLGEFRRAVVPAIAHHALKYRGNGVVIVNELSSLEPSLVEVLMPLLGRGSYFPEFSHVPLTGLIVIITTDFGREGRTRGMGLVEMRGFINEEFQQLYHRHSTSMIRTFPFMPISLSTAADIVRMAVQDVACEAGPAIDASHAGALVEACTSGERVPLVEVSEDAVQWLVEKVKPVLSSENGRAVVQEVASTVEPLLAAWRSLAEAQLPGSRIVLVVNDDGELTVVTRSKRT